MKVPMFKFAFFALTILALSCEKENITIAETAADFPSQTSEDRLVQDDGQTVSISWTDKLPTDPSYKMAALTAAPNTAINIEDGCGYMDCNEAITQVVAQMQFEADNTCEDQYYTIACCQDGTVTYALILVKHACKYKLTIASES